MAFYLVDKESGVRSNKTLNNIKKEFGIDKAGFSGVLDSFATGLLIIATDIDTKFLELFLKEDKVYTGTILFGQTTDTLDPEGNIVDSKEDFELNLENIEKIISEKFNGKINQTPPNFSNIKINGKRASELSKKNVDFELKEVQRTIYYFKVFNLTKSTIDFEIKVSSGTYIRSIAFEIGKELGIPSMLKSLRRTYIGNVKVPEKTEKVDREEIVNIKFLETTPTVIKTILNGRTVHIPDDSEEIILKHNEDLVWIKKNKDDLFKIKKKIR